MMREAIECGAKRGDWSTKQLMLLKRIKIYLNGKNRKAIVMKETYVSFEIAKLLKEKGLTIPSTNYEDWLCCMYDEDGNIHWGYYDSNWYPRITHQMTCAWLREVHNIFIEISTSIDLNGNYHYSYTILDKECKYVRKGYTSFDWKYQDAMEEALKYSLENLI